MTGDGRVMRYDRRWKGYEVRPSGAKILIYDCLLLLRWRLREAITVALATNAGNNTTFIFYFETFSSFNF
jgi:hypothetical protein